MGKVRAWAALGPRQPLQPFEFDPGPLPAGQVEVAVEHCGLCHSDLSLRDDAWGMSRFPLVPGHEAIGTLVAVGEGVRGLRPGQRVGVGWNAHSCQHCETCLDGRQHLCASVRPTLIGRHGAFAERVRVDALWAVPLPEGLDPAEAGPLLCGGITVFAPLRELAIPPTARVAVVGIGGLGHLALAFSRAWGCEVTAITSSPAKVAEALELGAHQAVCSEDGSALKRLSGRFDLILVTANASLDWNALLGALAPEGRLHVVGAVPEPIPVPAFALISGQKSVSGSPTGSRGALAQMLAFAARHRILPRNEHFPMSQVNAALEHLAAGRARYRVVLDADFT